MICERDSKKEKEAFQYMVYYRTNVDQCGPMWTNVSVGAISKIPDLKQV
jgi:hypothetical protein